MAILNQQPHSVRGLVDKQGTHMADVDVLCHFGSHDIGVGLQEIRVAIAGRGCDFEGHVQQLTHMRIEGGVIGNVPERGSIRGPSQLRTSLRLGSFWASISITLA